jgi:uncharacterized membrane protein YraQ (UPF0718 family)
MSSQAVEHEADPSAVERGDLLAELVLAAVVATVWFRGMLAGWLDGPAVGTWFTIFVAVSVQAMPFLVLGVAVSGAIAAFLPAGELARWLPARPELAVPLAGVAGVALPGCECGAVPIAGRLVGRGAPPAAALTFLLAAPAVNPVVVVATVVAFPGRPEVALARFVASLTAAVAVGLVWARVGRDEWVDQARRHASSGGPGWVRFVRSASDDFLHAGAFLVVGAMAAATLRVVVPVSVLDRVGGSGLGAVVAMAALAVLLAICSEADAFVAAGLSQFSLTARLVFLVVGPMVDLKLVALQVGVFGRAFAVRFAPLALVSAVLSALVVGWLVL